MTPDINNRITQLIENECNGNKRAFSKLVGVTPSVIENVVGSRGTKPSFDVLEKILNAFAHISGDWLITGKGEILSKEFAPPKLSNILHPQFAPPIIEMEQGVDYITTSRREFGKTFNEDYKGIPLLPLKAAAGVLSGHADQMTKYDCDYYLVPDFKDADFLIKINGDSMQPRYLSGDIVACRALPIDTFFQWNSTYAVNSEQGILIKRVKKAQNEDSITLVSDNKDYEPFDLHKSQIHGLGKVIGLIRLDD